MEFLDEEECLYIRQGTQETWMLPPDCDMSHLWLKAAFISGWRHLFFCNDATLCLSLGKEKKKKEGKFCCSSNIT